MSKIMNMEIATELGKLDAIYINNFYKINEIEKALKMTKICIKLFVDLLELPDGYLISSNLYYRTYIIELLQNIENKEYGFRSIVIGDYNV